AQPLQQESTRVSDANIVRTPGLETEVDILFDVLETLSAGLVQVLAGFDLFEDPGLNEGTAADHNGVHAGLLDVTVVLMVRVAVTISEKVHLAILGVGKSTGVRLSRGVRVEINLGVVRL